MVIFPDMRVKTICNAFIGMVNSVISQRVADVIDRPMVISAAGKTVQERESPSAASWSLKKAMLH